MIRAWRPAVTTSVCSRYAPTQPPPTARCMRGPGEAMVDAASGPNGGRFFVEAQRDVLVAFFGAFAGFSAFGAVIASFLASSNALPWLGALWGGGEAVPLETGLLADRPGLVPAVAEIRWREWGVAKGRHSGRGVSTGGRRLGPWSDGQDRSTGGR